MILSITGELERKCQLPLGHGEKGKKLKQILVVPIYSSNTKSKKSKLQPKKKRKKQLKTSYIFLTQSKPIEFYTLIYIYFSNRMVTENQGTNPISLKYSCSRALLAVILLLGSKHSIFWNIIYINA